MKLIASLCLLIVIGCTVAFPKSRGGYYPRSYMIGGSFYANPRYAREGPGYEYLPPGQMTAMVMGDTVASNSFSGSPYSPTRDVLPGPAAIPDIQQSDEEQVSEQVTQRQQPFVVAVPEPDSINETEPEVEKGDEQETLFSIEEGTTEAAAIPTTKAAPITTVRAPVAPARKVKVGKAKRPVAPPKPVAEEAEEESDDEPALPAAWPFAGVGARGGYNAFFPIFIGGAGSARTRAAGQDDGLPGAATAIANAFSTGKGGVATSHATSFGDPYAAAMLRNAGLFNFRTKTGRKQPVQEELEE
uniref:DUF4774 domain-containing protein n=1 Tax=Dendroctonus ponderosae TaxID=77166 RepID=A0AAR5Q937_DENPD